MNPNHHEKAIAVYFSYKLIKYIMSAELSYSEEEVKTILIIAIKHKAQYYFMFFLMYF